MTQEALIPLFKEQIESEFSKLKKENSLEKRGDYFIWWYFKALKNYSAEKIGEIYCDGGGDLGIDALDIDDDGNVHFYQFKNPEKTTKGFDGGDIDKIISVLNLILSKKYKDIANPELVGRIDEIYQIVPKGYQIHIITSSVCDLDKEPVAKLNAFVELLGGQKFITWSFENLKKVHDKFYSKTLPTLETPIAFTLHQDPYPVESSEHQSYFFHLPGEVLANLYLKHGEQLLQQNIRVFEGKNPTNTAIEATCAGGDSGNFFHYNNGITFLCEEAFYDYFKKTITLKKAQVVNGGQTIRVLSTARKKGTIKDDLSVVVRVISSLGDKEFANNVAVNLNNQTRVDSSFLKSNDPRVVQLANSLKSLGWYLERREDETKQLTNEEKQKVEKQIGGSIDDRIIPFKEATQSYVATFLQAPELAKKNQKLIFLEKASGGNFEKVFDENITAEKFLGSHKIRKSVDFFVTEFTKSKRKKYETPENKKSSYKEVLGDDLTERHFRSLDQAIPQCAIFLCGLIYDHHVIFNKEDIYELNNKLSENTQTQARTVQAILDFAQQNPEKSDKSWPTLLKSQTFFKSVLEHMNGTAPEEGQISFL